MKDVVEGPVEWEAEMHHERCGTSWTAEAADLQVDRFKQPGTYWFDGSADAAGLTLRFFVQCPGGDDLVFADHDSIPALLRDRLIKDFESRRK